VPALDHLLQDVRYALRGLRRSPGFTATAVITLALGIGANAAMFGVVDRLMFRPFPYLKDPGTVHRVYYQSSYRGVPSWESGGQYTRYLDTKNHTTSFSDYSGFTLMTAALGTGERAREFRVAPVSGTFWNFFAARPIRGRFFTPAEDVTPRGAAVAVLGYEYWQTEFGGADVVGQPLQVGHIVTTIVGVAPAGFVGVSESVPPAVYIPITLWGGSNPNARDAAEYYTRYNWGWMNVMVRRKPGVSIEQASRDVARAHVISWNHQREFSPQQETVEVAKPGAIVSAIKLGGGPNPSLEARTSKWLVWVSAIVLLIACANVANLFLARALRRQREIAVRLALGVSRGRLMAQTLTESLLLSLGGCVGAVFVAQWGGAVIRRMLVTTQGASLEAFMDWRTLGIVVGIALVAGVLTGIAPAVLSGRGDLAGTLKAGAREGTQHRSRTRTALLVLQGAMSVTLLVGAVLFVRSLRNVKNMRMGYDAENVLLVQRNFRGLVLDSVQRVTLHRTILTTVQHLPGVEAAAWVSSVPFWSTSSTRMSVTGIDSVARLGSFTYNVVTPDFFKAFGTRIVRGRGFTDGDRRGSAPVMVVGASAARALWPNQDPIGKCVRVGADTAPCSEVVGLAEDIVQRQQQMTDGSRFQYYMPLEQFRPDGGNFALVRLRGEPARAAEMVRQAVQAVMPGQAYVTVRPMTEIVGGARRSWHMGATLFGGFALLALLVAGVGLYGVIAYNVTQRMHELGVRIALGAQRADILRLVLGQGARLALSGVAVGAGLALVASRWIQPLLFQQSARDPLIYGVVAGVMLLVALVACAAPANRAAQADPNSALRAE
jgi:predicted permease